MSPHGPTGRAGGDEADLAAWTEAALGGRVTRVERLARWRPAWDVDLELDGRVVPLHARGEREPEMVMPFRIADEVRAHELLEAHGLPVPHAYGLCDRPAALVMDRLAGSVDLTFAADDDERARIIEEYLELQARIYDIPLDAAARAGFEVPADGAEANLAYLRRLEADYEAAMEGLAPDPTTVFLRQWLHRNVPRDREVVRFITYDAFQFMFDQGRITGLIDFELAHVGDPMMDLAALRVRDMIKNLGDLPAIAARYEAVTGIDVDHDVVDYQAVLYNALSVISPGPALASPVSGTDWLSYLAWYVNGARWAFEVIAEMGGYELDPVPVPEARPTRHATPLRHLVAGLKAASSAEAGDRGYALASLGRVANHLRRVDEVGAALEAADLDDLARVLGHRPDPAEADAELLDLVSTAGPERDEELVRLLDARAQRTHLTLASPTSMMSRHPRLSTLRPGRSTARRDDDGWPAGSIPGTA